MVKREGTARPRQDLAAQEGRGDGAGGRGTAPIDLAEEQVLVPRVLGHLHLLVKDHLELGVHLQVPRLVPQHAGDADVAREEEDEERDGEEGRGAARDLRLVLVGAAALARNTAHSVAAIMAMTMGSSRLPNASNCASKRAICTSQCSMNPAKTSSNRAQTSFSTSLNSSQT